LLPLGVIGFNGESILAPATVSVLDSFKTRNDFYGGQVGATLDFHPGKWCFLTVGSRVAFGNTHETLNTLGSTTLVQGTSVRTANAAFWRRPMPFWLIGMTLR